MWKIMIATGVFAALIITLKCGSGEEKNDKLVYWSSNNTYEIEFAREVVKDWNASQPDIRVMFQPVPEGQSSEEVILAAVVGKTTPDIYSNMWQGDVEAYAQAGVLIPLDTLEDFLPALQDRCKAEVIEEVRSLDGHIYQIPWKINPIMLISNVKMMESIGFDHPPATYSRYLLAGKRFHRDLDGDGYVDQWVGYAEVVVTWWQRLFDFYPLYLAASGGGKLVDGNQVAFDNKYAIEVFTFLQKLFDNNYFSRERLSARQDVFLSGVIATRFTGPWEIVHAENFKPEGFEYEFSSLPVPEEFSGPVYTYGDPKNIVIFNTCRFPQDAGKFLKFLINRRNDLRFLEMTNQVPRRKDLLSDSAFIDFFKTNPRMKPFARQADFVKGTDTSPVLKEVFDTISREYEACVVYGRKKPADAIRDAADAARLILN